MLQPSSNFLGLQYNYMDICDTTYAPFKLMRARTKIRKKTTIYDLDCYHALSLFYASCYNDAVIYKHTHLYACHKIEDSLLEMFMGIHVIAFQELVTRVVSPGLKTFSSPEDRLIVGMALRAYHYYYTTELKSEGFKQKFWGLIKRNLVGKKKARLYRYLKQITPTNFEYRGIKFGTN